MSYTIIRSDYLEAKILHKGAELSELKVAGIDHNWIWRGEGMWPRHAPILFPVVGKLKGNRYWYNHKEYTLPQHGFARDCIFDVIESSSSALKLRLCSSETTLKSYPFSFQLEIEFGIVENCLSLGCRVSNLGMSSMYFNFGWHPGFVMPLQSEIAKVGLLIEGASPLQRAYCLAEGLVDVTAPREIPGDPFLVLSEELLSQDALVFLDENPKLVRCFSEGQLIEIDCGGAPHLGIWSKSLSDFLCIEPWWGYADPQVVSGVISEKPGIQSLGVGEVWTDKVWVRIL